MIHVQDYYHASSATAASSPAPAPGREARASSRVDDAGVALDKEDGRLAAVAARRRVGCSGGLALEFDDQAIPFPWTSSPAATP